MDINKVGTNLYNEYDLNELIRKLQNQNVVLFIGAGFSAEVENLLGETMPLANNTPEKRGLAARIGELGGFNDEDDLHYAADEYLKNNSPDKLIKLLQMQIQKKKKKKKNKNLKNINIWHCQKLSKVKS